MSNGAFTACISCVRLLSALFVCLVFLFSSSAFAQSPPLQEEVSAPGSPPRDASFDLPPVAVPSDQLSSSSLDSEGAEVLDLQVAFGVLCLSDSGVCTSDITLLVDALGWWVEAANLNEMGGAEQLNVRVIRGSPWALIPAGQASWTNDQKVLSWARPLEQRATQDLRGSFGVRALPRSKSIPALVLHYGVSVDDRANSTVSTQAVWSRGDTSIHAGGVYSQEGFFRDLWRIEHDDVDRRVRYTLGEQIAAPSDPVGGAQVINGFGVSRAYDVDPLLVTTTRPGLHGIIEQPGVVDVYNNGRLVSSTPIQPGPYQWGNAPLGFGSQHIELVFRGADGSRSSLSSSTFFGASRLLAKGLTDFSFRAGKPRLEGLPGTNEDLVWQGWVRKGVSSYMTLGARAEGQDSSRSMGVDASVAFGVGSLDLAYARDHAGEAAWSATTTVARNGLDLQVSRTRLSPDYWFLGRDANVISGFSRVIDERRMSVGYGMGSASLRTDFSDRRALDGTRTRVLGVIGSMRARSGWRWFATLNKVFEDGTRPGNYQAVLGVAIPLDRAFRQELDARVIRSDLGRGAQVSWSRRNQDIFGWSSTATALSLPNGERGLSAEYNLSTSKGSLLLSGVSTNMQKFVLASWTGSVVLADDRWFVSTQDRGARALVRSSSPDAIVLRDNRTVGRVGKGRIVPQLPSYSSTTIALDPSSLPLEADSSQLQKTIVPPRTGVVRVDFDTTAGGQVEGVLLLNGVPARLGILTLENGVEGWVGETGRLWLQGVGKGAYKGTWTNGADQSKCSVIIDGMPLAIVEASCRSMPTEISLP